MSQCHPKGFGISHSAAANVVVKRGPSWGSRRPDHSQVPGTYGSICSCVPVRNLGGLGRHREGLARMAWVDDAHSRHGRCTRRRRTAGTGWAWPRVALGAAPIDRGEKKSPRHREGLEVFWMKTTAIGARSRGQRRGLLAGTALQQQTLPLRTAQLQATAPSKC